MAKPIFIINFGKMPGTAKDRDEIIHHFNFLKQDYHIIILFEDRFPADTTFQMFSDKEIDPIELDKLKELVNGQA